MAISAMWGEGYEIQRWREGGLLGMGDQGRAKELTSELNEERASYEAMEGENILSRRQSSYEGLKERDRSSKSNCTLEQGEPEESGRGRYPQRGGLRFPSH